LADLRPVNRLVAHRRVESHHADAGRRGPDSQVETRITSCSAGAIAAQRDAVDEAPVSGRPDYVFFGAPAGGGSLMTASGTWLATGGSVFRNAKIALRSSSVMFLKMCTGIGGRIGRD